jgi:hypothetical protein
MSAANGCEDENVSNWFRSARAAQRISGKRELVACSERRSVVRLRASLSAKWSLDLRQRFRSPEMLQISAVPRKPTLSTSAISVVKGQLRHFALQKTSEPFSPPEHREVGRRPAE